MPNEPKLVPGYEFTADGPRPRTDDEARAYWKAMADEDEALAYLTSDPWYFEFLKARASRRRKLAGS